MNKRLLSNAAPPGENAGKILEPTAVARQLVVAGPMRAGGRLLEASPGASLEVPAGVATKELRVVAFVQERASRRILGSGTRGAVLSLDRGRAAAPRRRSARRHRWRSGV